MIFIDINEKLHYIDPSEISQVKQYNNTILLYWKNSNITKVKFHNEEIAKTNKNLLLLKESSFYEKE